MSDFVWARKQEKHTSGNLQGAVCNGCRYIYIRDWEADTCGNPRMIDGRRCHPYYCDALHRELSKGECYTISAEECPEHREDRRRKR